MKHGLNDGGVWAHQRAQKHYKTVLNEYVAPPMDSAHRDQLADFVARRKAEGGAPTIFKKALVSLKKWAFI